MRCVSHFVKEKLKTARSDLAKYMDVTKPFNVAQGALWVHVLAQQCDLELGDLIISIGDAHIYSNHFEQVKTQLSRETKKLPKLVIKRKPVSIYDYEIKDFELVGYEPHPAIKAPIAI